MRRILIFIISMWLSNFAKSQETKDAIKLKLNKEGTHYIQATFLNQVWLRYAENNTGTTIQNASSPQSVDIGLRRTRMQLFGKINDHVFVYFQFGQNNFNTQYAVGGNRKNAAFFHDAVCEYSTGTGNALKIGGGLTIANGLSRFSQPGISSILTLDVPVMAQATVDQTDIFSRKLTVYARGQINELDYRIGLSDPFPITSNGAALPPLTENSTFSKVGRKKQIHSYLIWQFFEHEPHTTPFMAGTYLGKLKIWNIAVGGIYQPKAMWRSQGSDTIYSDMKLFCIESFLDMPLNKIKGTAISAYAGLFSTNYGKNYLRYNGIMNTGNGSSISGLSGDVSSQYGNAYPMFGTGTSVYTQLGYLMPAKLLKNNNRLLPYLSASFSKYERLKNNKCDVYHAGINWLIQSHNAKITLDLENRPTFLMYETGAIENTGRKNTINIQYQIFF